MIACETSRLWVFEAARIAEDPHIDPAKAVAYTGLARIAVESACLDAMRLARRSLGLGRSAVVPRSNGSAAISRPICACPRPMRRLPRRLRISQLTDRRVRHVESE
jgi:hypothetical protein